ncbi:uncharacterized protein LOC141873495 isoform X3 [Acropora palmata]|uniref:uncharacterized protein LOC141873495 isoform X3 n=1 Tax=Acropora palmata TaxID=6131 RepID=UPI003DA1A937
MMAKPLKRYTTRPRASLTLKKKKIRTSSRKSSKRSIQWATPLMLWPRLRKPQTSITLTFYGKLGGSTIVSRMSREKLEMAAQMKMGSQHLLEEENCFLDAEHDRMKGMKNINLSVLHLTIKEIVSIASMECETESTETLCDFWKCLNEYVL